MDGGIKNLSETRLARRRVFLTLLREEAFSLFSFPAFIQTDCNIYPHQIEKDFNIKRQSDEIKEAYAALKKQQRGSSNEREETLVASTE